MSRVVGRRIVAGLIDLTILSIVFLLLAAWVGELGDPHHGGFLPYVLIFFGYFIVFESAIAATPGKILLGLQVVRQNGYPYGIGAVIVRNALRVVDGLLFFTPIALTEKSQRIGDLAAGTLVVETTWNREHLRVLLGRVPLVALALGFLIVTFVAYYYTTVGPTGADQYVYLARSFLHGSVALQNGGGLILEPLNLPFELSVKEGKYYVVEPPMPAIILLPGVLLFGTALSQTLVSIVIGALNAPVVHGVVRTLRGKLTTQLWLTGLFVFGTIYWYAVVNGGVWYFAHTSAVFFLFLAIFFTLVKKNPFLAGVCLGAAYMSRLVVILGVPFFLIMFMDQWLPESRKGRLLLGRIDFLPLLAFGAGLAPLMLLNFTYNYLRFDTPLDAAYHTGTRPSLRSRGTIAALCTSATSPVTSPSCSRVCRRFKVTRPSFSPRPTPARPFGRRHRPSSTRSFPTSRTSCSSAGR